MNEYLLSIKGVVDSLISIGCQVTTTKHIEAIFDGFSEEYGPFIVFVNSRQEPYTITKIGSLLLAQQVWLEKHTKLIIGERMTTIASNDIKDKAGNNSKTN